VSNPAHIAVIGGGLSGLTAAIRLAQQGIDCELFEAAPALGGRTRSFYEPVMQHYCDNGPHLLVGAYSATKKLLEDCHASQHLHWQPTLDLPLWDNQRGHFSFTPPTGMPFALAMLMAASRLPGHDSRSGFAMLRLALALHSNKRPSSAGAEQWLQQLRLPDALIRDMLDPLCLGAMNEQLDSACAVSFKRVLLESFAGRKQACLGWFTGPLQSSLIEPLMQTAVSNGVRIHTRTRVRQCEPGSHGLRLDGRHFDKAVLALPAFAAARLLNQPHSLPTRPITNIHLWLEAMPPLPSPLVGSVSGVGQWYFDISQQWQQDHSYRHVCAVISADQSHTSTSELVQQCLSELTLLSGATASPRLLHSRVIREQRATVLVRHNHPSMPMPACMIDAVERPASGELPATIESAIRRGENAAASCISGRDYQLYPL